MTSEWTVDDGGDASCFEFEPAPVDGVYAAMGRAARPDLSPEPCWAHWETLPFVDCTDGALARYRAWVRRLTATATVVRP